MSRRALLTRLLALAAVAGASARARAGQPEGSLDGLWRGTLVTARAPLRLEFRFSTRPDGACLGTFTSVDEGGARLPLDRIDIAGDSVALEIRTLGATLRAARRDGGEKLAGTWNQGRSPLALELVRSHAAGDSAGPGPVVAPALDPAWGFPLLLNVPAAPALFTGRGEQHVAYELWLTDFSVTDEAYVTRIEVRGADSTLARFEGAELNALLTNPFARDGLDNRVIGSGRTAIAWLWLTFEAGHPIPARLSHRVTLRDGRVVEGASVAVRDRPPLALGAPLRGGVWIARGGPSNTSAHRHALLPLAGCARIAQRFAIDWTRVDTTGATFVGDPRDNRNYLAWGSDVLAVADGVIASTHDGVPENSPGFPPAVPITPATACGNYVVLDVGGGCFALYAHLQPRSLRIRPGDRVKRGQVLGLVGNSGNSQYPHLHFHLADANDPIAAEGVPYALERFEGRTPAATWEWRSRELPMANARVRFP